MLYSLIGALLGLLAGGFFYLSARRRIEYLEEEKLLVQQEKQIVVDFMHDMVEALGEGLTREELFQRIVHAAILSTGALSACLFERTADYRLRGVAVEGLFPPHRELPEGAKMKLTTRAKFIEQVLKSEVFDVGEGVVGTVAKTGKGILISDAQADPRIVKHSDPALVVKSVIAMPIIFRDRLIGVLALVNPADGMPFSERDFSLVQSLAEQSGMAIHSAEFMTFQIEKTQLDLDLALASNIQQMLLPQAFPLITGLDIDARYRPAQKVGGDLYDLFPLTEHRLGVAVADVSGKGIPASLLMAICRTNLRRIALEHDSPARVLSELNHIMVTDMRPGMFITVLFACIDTAAGEVTFARAGHELPLLCHRDPQTQVYGSELLGSEGMPLGMVMADIFDEVIVDRTVAFNPGDVLVLYTDGVTEAANEDEKEFSAGRLADAVKSLRQLGARELNDGILQSIERFSGQDSYRDDVTLVSIKRL